MRNWLLALSALLALSVNASADDSLSITPQDSHTLFNDSIDQAKNSIDMMMYHLSDLEVVKHLVAAQQRGVKVRIILDGKTLAGTTAKSIGQQLTTAGVVVTASSPAFSITHAKSAVFDNSWALVTSINLTRTDWYTRDFGIRTEDSEVISEFEKVFEADLVNAQNKTMDTPELSTGKLAWSPVNSKDKILALINEAKSYIGLEVENLGDSDVLAALEAKAKSGLKVVVIVPACVEGGGTRNLPFMQQLAAAGVDARLNVPPYTGSNPYVHAKAIVIDGNDFYVGSENFSYNSLTLARELGIIETNPAIASQILSTIAKDAGLATPSAQMSSTFSCASQTNSGTTGSN